MKILIGIEDKQFAEVIAAFLSKLQSWGEDTEFKIVHAIEPLYFGAVAGYPNDAINSFIEESQQSGLGLVEWLGAKLKEEFPCASVTCSLLDGHPKDEIVNTARKWKADMIVVGSHGRSGISQFLLGSVSAAVLSAAPCSVMVVKMAVKEADAREPFKKTAVANGAS
jgi:nucleotide-binding universal stress UspA family protein